MGNNKDKPHVVCLRTIFTLFNIILFVTGATLLALGFWSVVQLYKYVELQPDLATLPYLVLAIGFLVVLLALTGFPCIIYGNAVLLYIYACSMGCIYIINVGVAASLACFRDSFTKDLREGLTRSIMNYDSDEDKFGFAQSNLGCCGVSNYTDWVNLSPQRIVPMSCCVSGDPCITANYSDVHQRGCYEAIKALLEMNSTALLGFSIALLHLPLVGTMISCHLAHVIKKSRRRQDCDLPVK